MAAPSSNSSGHPSHPILISQGSRNKLTHQPKKNFTAHSAPNVKFQPPKAPVARPKSPPCDPPPIELPPSPPIFSPEDVQNELDRQRNQHLQRAAANAPLSRSLTNNHFSYPRNFSFSSHQSTSFRPHFPSVSEEADHPVMDMAPRPLNLSESPPVAPSAEFKAPHSYSDSSTIYSMMLRKNSLASAPPNQHSPPVMDTSSSSASTRPPAYADDADLQFAISLDAQDDSSMLHGSVDSSSGYTLNFRD